MIHVDYSNHPASCTDFQPLLVSLQSECITSHCKQSDDFEMVMKIIYHNFETLWEDEAYLNRLKDELEFCIESIPFFERKLLLYEEIVRFYHDRNKIVNFGRGSSASLLLCYVLKITLIDPILFNLQSDRFLGSSNIPNCEMNIDIDVYDRDSLISFLKEKYPNTSYLLGVRQGYTLRSSFATILDTCDIGFQAKKALQDELIITLQEIQTSSFPINNDMELLDKAIQVSSLLLGFFEIYGDAILEIKKLLGTTKSIQVHSTAIIITDEQINNLVTIKNKFGLPVIHPTFYEENVKELAFKRIDILNLGILKLINEHIGIQDLPNVDLNDKEVMVLLNNHRKKLNKNGFQTNLLMDLWAISPGFKFEKFKDIAIYTSICRQDAIDTYTYSFKKEFIPERFKDFVDDTNGHMVFQEQGMDILRILGLDPAKYRKLFSKKALPYQDMQDVMTKDEFEYLNKYFPIAFNMSHAICLAFYTYLDLYLRKKELLSVDNLLQGISR